MAFSIGEEVTYTNVTPYKGKLIERQAGPFPVLALVSVEETDFLVLRSFKTNRPFVVEAAKATAWRR